MRTEEELKWSQRHFQRLFEVLVDPVVIGDMNGNILEVSQSAEEILGFPREELVGKHFMEIDAITDKSKAVIIKNLEKTKKGKYVPLYTIESVTKDGKKLLYESTSAKLMYKGEPAILGIFHNITEQRKAEEKLRASEERFKYFIENAPEAIWVQDVNGTFIDGNKRAEELTGYKKEELIEKNMLDILVPPESIPRLLEAFKPDKLGEISGPNELELIKKDGSLVPVEATTIPVEREGKLNIIGIARDISERKKHEEMLRKAREKFETYFDLAQVILVAIDAKGNVTQINKKGCEVLGYKKKEIVEKNWFNNFLPKRVEKETNAYFRKLLSEQTEPVEYYENPVLTKEGKERLIAWHNILLRDEQGNIKGTLSSGEDITERKKAENALKESEEKFRTIFEGATDGIAALDPKTMKVIFTNRKMTEITGYVPDEMQKATIIDFVPKDEISSVIQQFQNHIGGKRDLTRYIPVIRKDKTQIYCDVRSKFLNIGNQQYLMTFVRDVTEQKKAEDALRKSKASSIYSPEER